MAMSLPSGGKSAYSTSFENLPRGAAAGRGHARQRSDPCERARRSGVEGDGDLSRGRYREDVRVLQAERPGVRTVGAPEKDLRRAAVPGRRVDDRLAVGAEAPAPDRAAPKGQLVKGGRRGRPFSRVQPVPGRRRDDETEDRGHRRNAAPHRGRTRGGRHRARRGEPGQRLEIERDVARRVEALFGILLQAVPHDPLEPRLDALVRRREVRRFLAQDRRHRLRRRVAVERADAREHLVQDRSEREDVRALVRGLALDLLGRHVAERSHDDAGLGRGGGRRQVRLLRALVLVLRQLRETEVEDLDPPVVRQKQVLGLEISMDDPLLVRRREPLRDLDRVVGRLAHRDRAAGHPRAQRLALEQLRHDVRRAVARVGPEVVHRRDVRVIQSAGRLGLLLEPPQPIGVLRVRRRQHLHRDVALQPLVPRPVNLPHPASADGRHDLVRAEP